MPFHALGGAATGAETRARSHLVERHCVVDAAHKVRELHIQRSDLFLDKCHPSRKGDNMSHPTFSVVLPVYNRERLVGRAIRSVLAQDERDFEILAVDDASTDGSLEILEAFDDPRVRIVRHSENRGGGASRNTGIHAARGDYIAFLDSDDYWLPRKLSVCRRLLADQHGDRWIVYHQYYIDTPAGRRTSIAERVPAGTNVAEYLFVRRGAMQTSAVLTTRALASSVGFDETLPRLQDWDFYLRAEEAGARFVMCTEVLTIHDVRADERANDLGFTELTLLHRCSLHRPTGRVYRGASTDSLRESTWTGFWGADQPRRDFE